MTLRQGILTALNLVHPHLLPENALVIDAAAQSGRSPTVSEVRAATQTLEILGQVVGINDADGVRRYRITDQGRAEVASFGS